MSWLTISFFILLIIFFVVGLALVLLALWDLRQGTNRRAFFVKGFFGVLLLLLAFTVPSVAALIGSGVSQSLSPTYQTQGNFTGSGGTSQGGSTTSSP